MLLGLQQAISHKSRFSLQAKFKILYIIKTDGTVYFNSSKATIFFLSFE
jgi:hypothetical protein